MNNTDHTIELKDIVSKSADDPNSPCSIYLPPTIQWQKTSEHHYSMFEIEEPQRMSVLIDGKYEALFDAHERDREFNPCRFVVQYYSNCTKVGSVVTFTYTFTGEEVACIIREAQREAQLEP